MLNTDQLFFRLSPVRHRHREDDGARQVSLRWLKCVRPHTHAGMVRIEADLLDDVREHDIADLLQRARDFDSASEDAAPNSLSAVIVGSHK